MSMDPRVAWALIAALAAGGCSRDDAAGTSRSGSGPRVVEAALAALPERDEFVVNGLLPEVSSPDELLRAFGQPDSLRTATAPNRHVAERTDTLSAIFYPALLMETHRPSGGDELVSSITVGDNQFLRFPIIGVTREEIEHAFGPPHEVRDGRYLYLCGECIGADEPVEIIFEVDRVKGVRFTYYVD